MSKKQIFISRISEETRLAETLADWIQHVYSSVQVSTSEKILPGEKWPAKLRDILKKADAFVVLCSPQSMGRHWLHMEVGIGWLGNTRIIPVCHSGLELSHLNKPLSDYMGLLLDQKDLVKSCERLIFIISNLLGLAYPAQKPHYHDMADQVDTALQAIPYGFSEYDEWHTAMTNACDDWEIPHSIDKQARFIACYPRVFRGKALSPLHLHVGAERLHAMLRRESWIPDLIIGLNEGGMIMATVLLKNYPQISVGTAKTINDKNPPGKKVGFLSLPVQIEAKPLKKILVVDSKCKSGASLLAVDKQLREGNRFGSNVEIRYGVILAYQPSRSASIQENFPWPIMFKNLACYTVFHTDMDPNHDDILETLR